MPQSDISYKKKSKKIMILTLILIVVIAVNVWFFWFSEMNVSSDDNQMIAPEPVSSDVYNLQKIKSDLVGQLKNLARGGKYGEWPLHEVSLSANRGNPFVKKR